MHKSSRYTLTVSIYDQEAKALIPDLCFAWYRNGKSMAHRAANAKTREATFEDISPGPAVIKAILGASNCKHKGDTTAFYEKVLLIEEAKLPLRIELDVPSAELLGYYMPERCKGFSPIAGGRLRTEVVEAYKSMEAAALKDKITLSVASATRNFHKQKTIWEGQWAAKTGNDVKRAKSILETISMPCTSRHHWGTDLDLVAPSRTIWGNGTLDKTYEWLWNNALTYGFAQPYTPMVPGYRTVGYFEEPWHWSYVALSAPLTQRYGRLIKNSDIMCFEGSRVAEELDMVKNYALSVPELCGGTACDLPSTFKLPKYRPK